MYNKKKLIAMGIAVSAMILSLSACSKKNNESIEENNKVEATVTPGSSTAATPTPEVERVEPSLTEDAKKLKQFAEVTAEDTIAEIVVKDFGTMKIKLFPEQAPKAVENFVTHAKEGYYDNVTFHRVIEEFMIQGGDPDGTGMGGQSIWGSSFEDEFSDDLNPYRGALCMANSGANTNGSQFFIVQANEEEVNRLQSLVLERYGLGMIDYVAQGYNTTITQKELDNYLLYGGTPWLTRHHTVFGQLYEGFDVLDAIATTTTNESGVPMTPVVIETIRIIEN